MTQVITEGLRSARIRWATVVCAALLLAALTGATRQAAAVGTFDWEGQLWDEWNGTAVVNGSGHAVFTRTAGSAADATLHVNRIEPIQGTGSFINAFDTPWIQLTYIDDGNHNIDLFIDDELTAKNPRLQAGSLWGFEGFGYARYTAPPTTEEVTFAVGTDGSAAGEQHELYVGQRADGTIDYRFDGVWYSTTFLKDNTGPFDFNDVHLRLRSRASSSPGGSVTFVDLQYGNDHEACAFHDVGSTRFLDADCTVDETFLIPDGFTLDGQGHTITAVDPAGGHFVGAIVKNAGTEAHVTNLTVTTNGLAEVCDGGNDRLRGILIEGAAGSITDSTVTDIRQATASGCQEGNAIEVRNAPFDSTGSDLEVTISGNTVTGYQKTGIVANGSVAATITDNTLVGDGPVTYIAQNGIQVGFGGTAIVRDNSVSGNEYTPEDTVACGLLMFEADGVKASKNAYSGNERDVCNFGKGGGTFNPNP